MKWTIISLIAGGALVYALIFAIHAQRDGGDTSATETAADEIAGAAVLESTPTALPSVLTDANETQSFDDDEVPASEDVELVGHPSEVTTVEEFERTWEGGAWAAGCAAFETSDYVTASAALEDAVREDESIAYRHYLLGLTYLKLDRGGDAVGELERSLELDPGHLKSLVHLGRAYLAIEDPQTAREVIDSALEADLAFADAWHVLGRVELGYENLDEADVAFRKAVANDPEHAFAWNNLGYVRILRGQFFEAVEPLQNATDLREDVAYFFNNLGVALERSDDPVAAVAAYDRAVDLGHSHAEASLRRVETIVLARQLAEPDEEVLALSDSLTTPGW